MWASSPFAYQSQVFVIHTPDFKYIWFARQLWSSQLRHGQIGSLGLHQDCRQRMGTVRCALQQRYIECCILHLLSTVYTMILVCYIRRYIRRLYVAMRAVAFGWIETRLTSTKEGGAVIKVNWMFFIQLQFGASSFTIDGLSWTRHRSMAKTWRWESLNRRAR